MSKNDDSLNNIILTRFMNENSLEKFLRNGMEVVPSLAAHKYSPNSNNHALEFGDYGLLGNPELLNPKQNIIYARDAATAMSPFLRRTLDDKDYPEFSRHFKDVPLPIAKRLAKYDYLDTEEYNPEDQEFLKKRFNNNDKDTRYFLMKLNEYAQNHGSAYHSNIPLDADNITQYAHGTRGDWWDQRTEEFGNPLQSEQDIQRVAKKLNTASTGYSQQRLQALLPLMTQLGIQFNIPEQSAQNLLRMGNDKKYPLPEDALESYLNNVNSVIRGDNRRVSEHERNAGEKIKKLKTPYMEIKHTGILHPDNNDYAGIIYPQTAYERKYGASHIQQNLKDIWGDNAVPYFFQGGMNNRDIKRSKMQALGELAHRAGILKKSN